MTDPVINPECMLKRAAATVGVSVIAQGRSAGRHGLGQDFADDLGSRRAFGVGVPSGLASWPARISGWRPARWSASQT